MLPIQKEYTATGSDGRLYRIEIIIKKHLDVNQYKQGIKATFKMFLSEFDEEGEGELMVLVDNHKPFGFHSHDKLPRDHDYRTKLNVDHYTEAWIIFQAKCKEILDA